MGAKSAERQRAVSRAPLTESRMGLLREVTVHCTEQQRQQALLGEVGRAKRGWEDRHYDNCLRHSYFPIGCGTFVLYSLGPSLSFVSVQLREPAARDRPAGES